MSGPAHRPACLWNVKNLLVAGRRVTGQTWAISPDAAATNVAARVARDLNVNIAAAVSTALRDPHRKVDPA